MPMPGKPLLRHKDKSMQRKTQWYATLPHRRATSATNTRTWQLTSLLSSHSCCPITGFDALMPWVDIHILSHQWFWVRAYLVDQKLISVIVRLLPRVGTGSACNDKGWRCRCLTSNGSSCITIASYKISLADKKDAFQLNEIEDRSKV